jgi:hypothetical protein
MLDCRFVNKSKCPHFAACELFPLISRPGFLKVWQINYCEGNHAACARFQKALSGRHVPITLLPNGEQLSRPPPK